MGMRLMLGGIVEAIGSMLGGLFNVLFNNVLSPILQLLTSAAIKSVIYSISAILYTLSTFLLSLIDFVEALFRALAGLSQESIIFTLGGSNSASPDLLIQMLTHKTVVDAFLSCCIVGIFLLLLTTIFQIIKVEYTTEGAQNSKSSIIGKSLKQFANLLLIPVLVIFGVVIGNSVLDLIDTATKGSDKASISGLLWTTAASNAVWEEGGLPDVVAGILGSLAVVEPSTLVNIGATIGLVEGFSEGITNVSQVKESLMGQFIINENDGEAALAYRDTVIQKFRDNAIVENDSLPEGVNNVINIGGNAVYSYGNPILVFQYFCIFEVNYLMLIFGACILIKCLFHVCFGMIDRIYQCVALFIVSPFVIGMAPVKDSLASWRSKFIQKALSAYGTIISINLFFIIAGLFMNIDIRVTRLGAPIVVLGVTMIEGLIKALFIIVGGLMIEKLAGDLGQYFGGGNAMSEGKGLADDATKGIKTAVKTGIGVAGIAAGGVGLAVKGVSMASKLAKGAKTAKSLAGNVTQAQGGVADALGGVDAAEKDAGGIEGMADYAEYEAGKDYLNTQKESARMSVQHYTEELNRKDLTKIEREELVSKKHTAQKEMVAADQLLASYDKDFDKRYTDKGEEGKAEKYRAVTEARAKLSDAKDNLEVAEKAKADYDKEKQDKRDKRSQHVRDTLLTGSNALVQSGKDLIGSMPGMNIVNDIKKDWDGARDKGNSASAEGKSALEREKKRKEDKAETAYNENLFNKNLISQTQKAQNQLITKAVIEKAEFATSDLNNQMSKLVQQWEGLAKKPGKTDSDNRTMEYLENAMRSLNPKVEFNDKKVVNAEITLDITAFKNNIEAAIKKNATTDQINEIIANQLKAAGLDGNATLLKELKKAVEEVKNSIGGK